MCPGKRPGMSGIDSRCGNGAKGFAVHSNHQMVLSNFSLSVGGNFDPIVAFKLDWRR